VINKNQEVCTQAKKEHEKHPRPWGGTIPSGQKPGAMQYFLVIRLFYVDM